MTQTENTGVAPPLHPKELGEVLVLLKMVETPEAMPHHDGHLSPLALHERVGADILTGIQQGMNGPEVKLDFPVRGLSARFDTAYQQGKKIVEVFSLVSHGVGLKMTLLVSSEGDAYAIDSFELCPKGQRLLKEALQAKVA